MIFNKNTAIGVLHHSSTQDPPNTDEENELENQYLNSGVRANLDNDSSEDDTEQSEQVTQSGKRSIQARDGKSKKESRKAQMGEALAAWAEASKAKAERYKARSMEATSSNGSVNYSLAKCVTALEEIDDIANDIFMKALQKFKDPDWREMFLTMSLDKKRAWLYNLE